VSNDSKRPPMLLILYRRYLDEQDRDEYARRTSTLYSTGTLQRLAMNTNHEVRRAAVLALGLLGDYDSNHTLGCALLDDDRTVRMLADDGIRKVWNRAGNEAERKELKAVIRLNESRMYKQALARAAWLIERAPWFAEAWHQRAIAHAALGRLVESIRDCHQTLEINPYHFVAAASMGQAYVGLGNPVSALECFRRALRLNPGLEGVRAQVERLAKMVEDGGG